MCIEIFSFRAFDRRLARLAAPISSGVRQGGGGRICPPPSGARSAEYPSWARVKTNDHNIQNFQNFQKSHYMLTLLVAGGGCFYPPLGFFLNISQTALARILKFSDFS